MAGRNGLCRDEGRLWKGRGAEKDGRKVTGKDKGIVRWEDKKYTAKEGKGRLLRRSGRRMLPDQI